MPIALLITVILLMAVSPSPAEEARVEHFPDLQLPRVQGSPASTAALLEGKRAIVFCFASW